jgi:hypothetical protein
VDVPLKSRVYEFDWHGDVKDEAYYAFVCEMTEALGGDPKLPGQVMALYVLYTAHDEYVEPTAVRLAQHYMESFCALASLAEGEVK